MYVKKSPTKKPVEETKRAKHVQPTTEQIDQKAMVKRATSHFEFYQHPDAPDEDRKDLSKLHELKTIYGKTGGEIFYAFLDHMPEWNERSLTFLHSYIELLIDQEVVSCHGFVEGVNKFLKVVCDLEVDCPKLSTFVATLLVTLVDHDAIDFASLKWVEDGISKDNAPMVEALFKILALFL